MNSTFNNLGDEKKDTILNAAIEEFSRHSYKSASTNRIVKNAGIGKGMLFYYFKSKKNLYLYLVDIAFNDFMENLVDFLDKSEKDLFNRIFQWNIYKIKMFIKEPQKFNFLMKISAEESPEVKNEIKRKYSLMSEKAYELLLKNIDLSNFRKDIDTEKAVNIIFWFFDSYVNKTINKLREGIHDIGHFENDTLKEFNEYLEILSRLMTDA
ncbi:MAG: TetR/AcrR family transcriptional regulator [Clostridiales bacterium]|nr:TetR/AcrR family transcriptional regulator [Clostridiales bacterium]